MALYEPIMNTLFAFLQAQCGGTFAYYSRRFVTWEQLVQDVGQIPQPALFLYDGIGFGGGITRYDPRGRGTPGVRTVLRSIVVYAQIPGGGTAPGPDGTTPGGTVFAPLVESVENAFNQNDSEGALTLGGLVSHAWIEGESHWLVGDIDPNGQGMLTIPVSIMVP